MDNIKAYDLEKLLKKWQHILDLDNWTIKLTDNCTIEDIGENSGYCDYDELHKCAVIYILDEKQYGDRILPLDIEKTLVHELLHIKFWFLDKSESIVQNRLVHQLIEDMAKALVSIKRNKE